MHTKITSHNSQILKEKEKFTNPTNQNQKNCNCRTQVCPLEGHCLTKNVVYKATVTSTQKVETYTGMTGQTFKMRFNSHKSDFRHQAKRTSTALASHIFGSKG